MAIKPHTRSKKQDSGEDDMSAKKAPKKMKPKSKQKGKK